MRRRIRQYEKLRHHRAFSRHPLANHLYSALAKATPHERHALQPMVKFLPTAAWAWFSSTVRYLFCPRHPFPGADCAPQSSHYTVPNSLRVSIAGDWGTGTEEAHAVAVEMMKWEGGGEPDLTIHIGDIYYVGGMDEVRRNCLAGDHKFPREDCVSWPAGRLGSFALNGNHEMLARGKAYFDLLLPELGMKGITPRGQGASFFCVENEHWRILGIDTGYNSAALLWQPSCKLPSAMMDWLAGIIPKDDHKATVLVSHQQYFSAFEDNYPRPARQLAEHFKRPVLWLWGHEHRSSAYGLHQLDGVDLLAHGRCIGHSGMPVEVNAPATKAGNLAPVGKLLFVDRRINPLYPGEDPPMGINGFAQLEFNDQILTINHKSLVCGELTPNGAHYPSSTTLLTETFTCNGPDLQWHGFKGPLPNITGFEVYPNGKDGSSIPTPLVRAVNHQLQSNGRAQ